MIDKVSIGIYILSVGRASQLSDKMTKGKWTIWAVEIF